jgi:hypothetical protein
VEVDPSTLAVEDLGHKVHVTDDGRCPHVLEVLDVHILVAQLRLRLFHGQELPRLLCERELVERVRQVREVRDVVRVLKDCVGVKELVGEGVREALRERPWGVVSNEEEKSAFGLPGKTNPARVEPDEVPFVANQETQRVSSRSNHANSGSSGTACGRASVAEYPRT